MSLSSTSGKLTIDLRALKENYGILQRQVRPGCRVGAAVKADAYGLGAAPVVQALIAAGCDDFFVSSPAEALTLRENFRNCKIYVLNGFYNSHAALYTDHDLIPMLGSMLEIESYKAHGKKCARALPAFLSFNIRMNRLGLGAVETEKLLAEKALLAGIDVRGLLSHFACADDPAHPLTAEQFKIFQKISACFPGLEKSLANSSGIFRSERYHFDLVRPGMALYGLNPVPEKENPMRPVVRLSVPVIRVRQVYEGASIGYGATYRFDKDTWIATVSAGYADGIFRSLGNCGALYWKGYRCPIRGRVSMDLTSVDLSAVPEEERPRPGDMMEVIGDHQSADDLAHDAGTIGYEILTALGQRYERHYIGAS
jgi:alanine racemase